MHISEDLVFNLAEWHCVIHVVDSSHWNKAFVVVVVVYINAYTLGGNNFAICHKYLLCEFDNLAIYNELMIGE